MNVPPEMIPALIQALVAATLFGVLPGWFWAATLSGSRKNTDLVQRLAFSIAFSMTLIPAVTLLILVFVDTSITLTISLLAALVVLLLGLAAYAYFGASDDEGSSPEPTVAVGAPALALISIALGLALWATLSDDVNAYATATAVLIILAGMAAWLYPRRSSREDPAPDEPGPLGRVLRSLVVVVVLVLVSLRGYSGIVLHDWPYVRGGDQFNHGVMANQMLSEGNYDQYLVYPPGFSIMTAGISNLSGLTPVDLYPVLAPALLILPALALYALAKRLWGWECGVAAMTLSGLLHAGTYANIEQARYPNLVSAQFLLVLAIAALVALYRSPTRRSIFLFGMIGSSAVLYHSVGTFYAALLFALVCVFVLPYLLLRHRRTGLAVLASMALLGLFAVAFAWDTYSLPDLVGGLFGGSSTGAGGEAVSLVIGTQPTFELPSLPKRVSPPVLWLGLLGMLLMFVPGWNRENGSGMAERVTLVFWIAILFVGSRTTLSGFPQRFERDLGIPLAALGAFALVVVLRSVMSYAPSLSQRSRQVATLALAVVALCISFAFVGIWGVRGIEDAAEPAEGTLLNPDLVEAGDWLRENKSGGNIVTSPSFGSVTNRGMLALGGYDRLQSFAEKRVKSPRSLPPAGRSEIEDAGWMLQNPSGERAAKIIDRYDIRYAVLSKRYPGTNPRAFASDNNRYRIAFQNDTIVIFAPREKNSS